MLRFSRSPWALGIVLPYLFQQVLLGRDDAETRAEVRCLTAGTSAEEEVAVEKQGRAGIFHHFGSLWLIQTYNIKHIKPGQLRSTEDPVTAAWAECLFMKDKKLCSCSLRNLTINENNDKSCWLKLAKQSINIYIYMHTYRSYSMCFVVMAMYHIPFPLRPKGLAPRIARRSSYWPNFHDAPNGCSWAIKAIDVARVNKHG